MRLCSRRLARAGEGDGRVEAQRLRGCWPERRTPEGLVHGVQHLVPQQVATAAQGAEEGDRGHHPSQAVARSKSLIVKVWRPKRVICTARTPTVGPQLRATLVTTCPVHASGLAGDPRGGSSFAAAGSTTEC